MRAIVIERHCPGAVVATATPDDWPAVFTLVNTLLGHGKRVLMVTEPGEPALDPGSFVIPLATSFDPWFEANLTHHEVTAIARSVGVRLHDLGHPQRMVAMPARLIRVGLYGGGGAPYNQAAVLAACGFPIQFLSDADVRAGGLSDVDVFVMPGGGARSVMGQVDPLGAAGCQAIATFVRRGGLYIGSCAGSYGCIVNADEFYERCPTQRHLQLLNARPARSSTARGSFGFFSPGVGSVVLRNEQPDHPVMFGMPAELEIVHYNGPVFEPTPELEIDGASAILGLASFAGWTEHFTPSEAFFGETPPAHETYLGQSIAAHRLAIVVGELGVGRVVAFGPHPEFGSDPPMVEWSQPARMLVNAVMWRCWSPASEPAPSPSRQDQTCSLPAGSSLETINPILDSITVLAHELQRRSLDPTPQWLRPGFALSTFGLPPAEIWTRSLADIVTLAAASAALASQLREQITNQGLSLSPEQRLALAQIDGWVLDERASEWRQDLGYQGVRALLRAAAQMCRTALLNWDIALPVPHSAYDSLAESPYHLVAGSYLGAIGHVAGAYQLLRAMAAVWSNATPLTTRDENNAELAYIQGGSD